MSREVHVRFCEGPGVKFLRPTHPYIRVQGEWKYLYRAIDRDGALVDVMLSEHRDLAAVRAYGTEPISTSIIVWRDHRGIKGRCRPILGFKSVASAKRYCRSHDELRNFLRCRSRMCQHVPAATRRFHRFRRIAIALGILEAA